ncbi:MAG: hypothetical protein ABDH19_06375 [Thermodesulfovibrio sp.]
MFYFDVSIPLKLKTLTYQYDEELNLKGFAVQVPLKNKLVEGIVIDKTEKPEGIIQIKRIHSILQKVYEEKFIDFLKWISSYYLSEMGSVLRTTFFEEVIALLKGKKIKKKSKKKSLVTKIVSFPLENYSPKIETVSKIVNLTKARNYKTVLVHCPNFFYELRLMIEVVRELLSEDGTTLLIVPEIKDAQILFNILSNFNERVVLLHSDMTRSELLFSIKEIIEDNAKVIVGTRFALFAPAKKLSLIMVAQESSWLYKAEESPRYNTRDCAVMRGFIEGCPVVLTDFMPSTTSYYNALIGKYDLIDDFDYLKHPEIKILRQPYQSIFHPETLLYLKLHQKEGVLVTSPRSGYSLVRCSECGEVIKCEKCKYSMIFRKSLKILECLRCNVVMKIPQQCPQCAGFDMHSVGVGIERITEELKNIFSGKNVEIRELDLESEQFQGVWVSQTGKIKKGYSADFKGGVIVDFDFFLSIPDYRAFENAFAKVLSICQLIRKDGVLFIQTRNPEGELFRFIRSKNFKGFYLYELKHREQTGFPPFSRLIKLMIKPKKRFKEESLKKIKDILKTQISGEVIGPIKDQNKGYFVFILRSRDKKKITEETKISLSILENFKDISFKIEVDPVSLKI